MAVRTLVDEQSIVDIWERQAFSTVALRDLDMAVVFRGIPSDAGGPDYQDAILSVAGGRIVAGDIEFHVHAGDWYRHGHHLNAAYNRVILHVVWEADAAGTFRQDGVSVPVLVLDGRVRTVARAPHSSSSPLLPHPCVGAFARLSRDELWDEVRRLGTRRFEERAARFAADLSIEDADQVAYSALLEGLGYASNRRAFAQLADAVPYGWLQAIPPAARFPSLLAAARLGPAGDVPPPAYLPVDSWRLAMLRPANHPARRLQGIVALLARMTPSVARAMEEAVLQAGRPSDLRNRLLVRTGGEAYIGPGRADELAVSVVLPLVSAMGHLHSAAAELFASYPSPPPNRWTRHMLSLLEEAGHDIPRVKTAAEHQGLHYLYHVFCRAGGPATCPLCRVP